MFTFTRLAKLKSLATVFHCLFEKMADSLAKYGLYIDDLSKIRVLDPEVVNQAVKLKDEGQNFVTSK